MGHNISAFKNKKQGNEVAYIRFAAWNITGQFLFYESLNANEQNGGCSGNGGIIEYTVEQIKIAKSKLKYICGEDDICHQINRYSISEKHEMFKDFVKKFSGKSNNILEKESEATVEREAKIISQFFDEILSCNTKKIFISFS